MTISLGSKAPDFTLKSKKSSGLVDVKLSDNFGKKNTVLLFFPAAFTGVCTQEMCDISAGLNGYSGLNADVIGDNQQYRIDLVMPSAPIASVAKSDVLATIFKTRPGDPARQERTPVSFDLSPWAGQTVRLRLAVADSQGPLRAGVDDIRFVPIRR